MKVPENIKDYLMEAHGLAGQWSLPDNRGSSESSQPIPLESVGIVGGGTMGRGMAISFCLGGFTTYLVLRSKTSIDNCKKELEVMFNREKKFKRLNDKKIEQIRLKLVFTMDYQTLKDCDLVVEAIYENLKMKKELFDELERVCKPTAIFGTNTSSLNMDEIASVLKNPSRMVGMHFINPANLIKMVEIVYGSNTSAEAVATAFEACTAIKKLPILVANCPLFVFNRLLLVYVDQSLKLMYDYGYLPHQIDAFVVEFGMLMGPLTMGDMNGLDVMERLKSENGLPTNVIEKEMFSRKRYGRKTDKGFNKYDPKTQKKEIDMEMELIVRNVSQGAKPNIRILNQQDAMDFLLYPMINEGFRCIEEGVIAQENLIDIMLILGFGWPIATGGPMRYGRSQGIEKLANTMLHWHVLEPKDRVYTVAETLKNIDKNNIVSKM